MRRDKGGGSRGWPVGVGAGIEGFAADGVRGAVKISGVK